jgi:transposase
VGWSTPYRIELADDERVVIEQRARSSNAPFRAVIRARIVLYAAEGLDNVAIADRLDASRSFVSRVRKRFYEERLKGLEERPRSGRPVRFSP